MLHKTFESFVNENSLQDRFKVLDSCSEYDALRELDIELVKKMMESGDSEVRDLALDYEEDIIDFCQRASELVKEYDAAMSLIADDVSEGQETGMIETLDGKKEWSLNISTPEIIYVEIRDKTFLFDVGDNEDNFDVQQTPDYYEEMYSVDLANMMTESYIYSEIGSEIEDGNDVGSYIETIDRSHIMTVQPEVSLSNLSEEERQRAEQEEMEHMYQETDVELDVDLTISIDWKFETNFLLSDTMIIDYEDYTNLEVEVEYYANEMMENPITNKFKARLDQGKMAKQQGLGDEDDLLDLF